MSVLRGNNGPRYKHNADESAPYDTITVDKLTPIIGAEIGGVDLSQPLGNQTFQEIHRALAENLVIFFRDQHITDEQHLEFGRSFGKLHIHPAAPHEPGHPELMIIHADKDLPRANGEGWHSDVSCDEEPPMGSILYIRTCPPRGGDTLFASMYAAYEALSDRMKRYLEGLDRDPRRRGLVSRHLCEFRRRRQAELSARRASGDPHASGDRQEGALCEPRFHPAHRRRAARRECGDPALPVGPCGEPAVPVPLPLAGELDRVLGQSLRAASCDVGLLAAHPLRPSRHGAGRQAGVMANAPASPFGVYLEHLEKGELAYQFSPDANAAVFYPRVICPVTGSDNLQWRLSKGLGTVHATTVVYPQKGEPYNVALIDVDEGFRMMSRVEDIAPLDVRIGMRVTVPRPSRGGR